MGLIKVGIVGVGKIAIDQHVPSIAETGVFEVAALVSQRGVTRPGVPTFATQREMLATCRDLEAVAICTPPDVRHAYVAEALAAGKHVLMEKPPTASVAELADLVARGQAARKTLYATWHSRYNAGVGEARRLLAERTVKRVTVTWKEDVRRWHPGQEWIWRPGGFGVFDPGINALSILTRIMPFTPFVESAQLLFPANRQTPIAASVRFRAPAAAGLESFTMELDWRQEGEQTWTIAIETDGPALELTRGGTCLAVDGKMIIEQADAEYRHIYRRFAQLIQAQASDVDPSPLHLVADAFLVGDRRETAAFDW